MPTTTTPAFFIRNYLDQTPKSPTGGIWSVSPDVVISGTGLCDWAAFKTDVGYKIQYPAFLAQAVPNFVWVRGRSTIAEDQTVRIWLYLAESDLLFWPNQCWVSSAISVAGLSVNYQTVSVAANGVGLTPLPFVVTPPPPQCTDARYALIALAEPEPLSSPPNPPLPADFDSLDQFSRWAASTPTVGFLYTAPPSPAPAMPYATTTTRAQFREAGTYQVGYAVSGMPTDVTISCVMAGPDFVNSVNVAPTTVADPNVSVTRPVKLPDSFSSSIVITAWRGATPIPDTATIRPLHFSQ